jgi:ferredoxin
VSVVIAADSYNKEDVENSMSACPVDAIVWED